MRRPKEKRVLIDHVDGANQTQRGEGTERIPSMRFFARSCTEAAFVRLTSIIFLLKKESTLWVEHASIHLAKAKRKGGDVLLNESGTLGPQLRYQHIVE